jgi:multicomponent Na+:H+ antiporter subunit F
MSAELILDYATNFALAVLPLSFMIAVIRVILGPTLPDRVVALDMLVSIAIGFIAVIALKTGYNLYIDIAIALGLVGFLATVAFARFVLTTAGKGVVTDKPVAAEIKKKPKPARRKS